MKVYWTLASIPELTPLNRRERIRVVKSCWPGKYTDPCYWRSWVPLGIWCVVVTAVMSMPLGRLHPALPLGAIALIYAGTMVLLSHHLDAFRPHLRRYLWRHHPDRCREWCIRCGYNLRGTTADACPECGGPIPRDRRHSH